MTRISSLKAALFAFASSVKQDFRVSGVFPNGLIAALMGCVMVPIILFAMYGSILNSGAWREAPTLLAAALDNTLAAVGLVPLDVVRILAVLMAVHYLLHLPKVVRNTRINIKKAKGFARKCLNGLVGFVEIGVKVAVPVLFYAVFVGGHGAQEIANHTPIA